MTKQQSSLDSFFNTGTKPKKQKTLTSFFNKENSQNNDDDDKPPAALPTLDTAAVAATKETTTATVTPPPAAATAAVASSDSVKKSNHKEDDEVDVEVKEEDDTPETLPPALLKLQKQASKLVQQAKVVTDSQLEPLESPVRYQDLVQVLEQIEALSGRLEIQALATTLFRRLLKYSPQDLYAVVYLASCSIAPAYKCLELGIGDSILMKAIADSYGTKASK